MLIAKEHHEGREDEFEAEAETEDAPDSSDARDLPEPALAQDGDLDWRPA
jgi:hypothetical protein